MALSNEEMSAAMSHKRLSVASSCICKPVSMLMRRITFTFSQRFWMVSERSSENTSTTNLSGGDEEGSADSGASIGNIFLAELTTAGGSKPASCEMPSSASGKLTEVWLFFLPDDGQMYRVGCRPAACSHMVIWHAGTNPGHAHTPFLRPFCTNGIQFRKSMVVQQLWLIACNIKICGGLRWLLPNSN